MKITESSLPGVYIIEPRVFSDERGFFFESFRADRLAEAGINANWVQDNHSRSQRGVLRGLHYQLHHPQAKLCRVVAGEVLDVAVDIRRSSPHFGQWVSVLLSAQNKRQVYVPRGFAHGFLVLSETAEFLYKCDEYYHPEDERGIAWDDPQIAVDWQIPAGLELVLSAKDRQNPMLSAIGEDELPR